MIHPHLVSWNVWRSSHALVSNTTLLIVEAGGEEQGGRRERQKTERGGRGYQEYWLNDVCFMCVCDVWCLKLTVVSLLYSVKLEGVTWVVGNCADSNVFLCNKPSSMTTGWEITYSDFSSPCTFVNCLEFSWKCSSKKCSHQLFLSSSLTYGGITPIQSH